MPEPCADCGSTSGVRAFGFDNKPLCPRCYLEAELNMTAAEAAARPASVADSVAQLVKDVMILRAAKARWDRDVNNIDLRSAYNRALIRVLGKDA